jgi:hypothetical protein
VAVPVPSSGSVVPVVRNWRMRAALQAWDCQTGLTRRVLYPPPYCMHCRACPDPETPLLARHFRYHLGWMDVLHRAYTIRGPRPSHIVRSGHHIPPQQRTKKLAILSHACSGCLQKLCSSWEIKVCHLLVTAGLKSASCPPLCARWVCNAGVGCTG